MAYCEWLYRLEENDRPLYGDEAVDLQTASRSGASILPGFVISKQAYAEFFNAQPLRGKIEEAYKGLTPKRPQLFAGAAQEIRGHILKSSFPAPIAKRLAAYLQHLEAQLVREKGSGLRLVVRLGEQQLSCLVKKPADLEKALKSLYALTFHEKALLKRLTERNVILQEPFAIMVQYEERPDFSGVAFSHDPIAHDDKTIQIQAAHSQHAEGVSIEDVYRVDRKSLSLLSRKVEKQWWAEDGDGKHISPAHLGKPVQTLTDQQAIQLARQIKLAQSAFRETMRFTWTYSRGQFWLVQAIPYVDSSVISQQPEAVLKPLLIGKSGALGWAYGPIRLVRTKKEQAKVKDGDIVVVEQLHPNDYTWLAGAKGLICEAGTEATSEGKIAKQLGVPAVVGIGNAFSKLRSGQTVTVVGNLGLVYAGLQANARPVQAPTQDGLPVTGTKIYSIVSDPHLVSAEDVAVSDGIGLLRGEFILRMLNVHPRQILSRKLEREYSEVLAENLELAVRSVAPRPVIYQLHDLATANIHGLHARDHERFEPNPALGYRGAHRLLAEPEILDLEIQALTRLASRDLSTLSVMMPMARTVDEVERMLDFLKRSSYAEQTEVRLWIKCETPAMAILMEELCQLDIAGVCFDVPAISQLITGFDRDNMQVAHHLDQASPAVEQALSFAIATCHQYGVATMLVAEMEDLRPEIVQAAIEAGVTSLSVSPERLAETHGLVASIERRIILDSLLEEPV